MGSWSTALVGVARGTETTVRQTLGGALGARAGERRARAAGREGG